MIWFKNETDLTEDDYINITTLICVWALSAHSVLGCKFDIFQAKLAVFIYIPSKSIYPHLHEINLVYLLCVS